MTNESQFQLDCIALLLVDYTFAYGDYVNQHKS